MRSPPPRCCGRTRATRATTTTGTDAANALARRVVPPLLMYTSATLKGSAKGPFTTAAATATATAAAVSRATRVTAALVADSTLRELMVMGRWVDGIGAAWQTRARRGRRERGRPVRSEGEGSPATGLASFSVSAHFPPHFLPKLKLKFPLHTARPTSRVGDAKAGSRCAAVHEMWRVRRTMTSFCAGGALRRTGVGRSYLLSRQLSALPDNPFVAVLPRPQSVMNCSCE